MATMHGDPARRRVLGAANGDHDEAVFEPLRTREATMGQQSVIADIDPQEAEQPRGDDGDDHGGPVEELRHQGQQGERVDATDDRRIDPVDPVGLNPVWQSEKRLCEGGAGGKNRGGVVF